jgi:hypothetical protein
VVEEEAKQETSVEADATQGNRLAEIPEYRKPVGQSELPVPIACPTQPSESRGDKTG